MAMSYVGGSSAVKASGNNTLTFNKVSGIQKGDIILVSVSGDKNTWTPPTGFTQIQVASTSGTLRSYLYWKAATGSEPSTYNFVKVGTAIAIAGTMDVFRGVDFVSPIMDSAAQTIGTVSANTDPNCTLTVNRTATPSRTVMWRTCIANTSDHYGVLTESSGGWTAGTEAHTPAGDTKRPAALCIYTGDFGSLGSGGGPAGGIKADETCTDNVFFMVQLYGVNPATGTSTVQLGHATAAFAGTRATPSGDVGVQLGHVDVDLHGIATPPAGSLDVDLPQVGVSFNAAGAGLAELSIQLGSVSVDFAATHVGGSFSMQLQPVRDVELEGEIVWGGFETQLGKPSFDFTGSVNPIGGFTAQLGHVTVEFTSETRPFGAQVIFVEPEKRGLRVTQDDTTPIYASEVTQE